MASALPGWLWNGEAWVTDDTVEGAWARGMVVKGHCQLFPECSRRITLAWSALVSQGFSRAPIFEIERLYECRRPLGCRMSWGHIYPEGVPLQAYVRDDGIRIRITCQGCAAYVDSEPVKLIRGLQARGRGGGNTGLFKLTELLAKPCRCGARRWRVEVRRPPVKMGLGAE